MSGNGNNDDRDAVRTGGERRLRDDLEKGDETAGEKIRDRPGSANRQERRRSKFIDLHGDEDDNPDTSERTYRQQHGDDNFSQDSSPSTTSTSSTARTTSTSSSASTTSTTSSRNRR